MYTLSCLQVALDFLNREWMYLIYGEQKKSWYKSFKNSIHNWFFYLLDTIYFKDENQFTFKKDYQFLIIAIITSLGAFFTAYKVMKILLSLEVKKSVMEFQCCRNENSYKMSPAFHENNNESPQLTEDFTFGTYLTAIVKPTIRTSETWESIKAAKDDPSSYESKDNSEHGSNASGVPKKMFGDMDREGDVDIIKPLVKCTSSLYVVTSKDSLNAELRTEFTTDNIKPLRGENGKVMMIMKKVNDNMTFATHESSSVCEVDDVISTSNEDTDNHYQCSISAYVSPDKPSYHKNSSYVSGHFVENFPDLDLSPIPNVPPRIGDHEQSLKFNLADKGVEGGKLKKTGRESNQQKYSSETGQRFRQQIYLSSSSACSPRCLNESSERLSTCFAFETYPSDQKTTNHVFSKIPRPSFSLEYEDVSHYSKLETAGSKIPVPLKKSQTTNVPAKCRLDLSPRKSNVTPGERSKETEMVDLLRMKESEQSLKRFMQLEIATGCCDTSDITNAHFSFIKS